MRKVGFIILTILSLLPFSASAQQKEEVGDILYSFSISDRIGESHLSVSAYSEFTLHYQPVSLGYNYSFVGLNYSPVKWLTGSLGGGYTEEDGPRRWLGKFNFTETIDRSSFRVWFRELYTYYFDPDNYVHSDLLRLRANILFKTPSSSVSPLLAAEVYMWDRWKRTSLYAGCRISASSSVTMTVYYMASFLETRNMQHLVLSTGLSF